MELRENPWDYGVVLILEIVRGAGRLKEPDEAVCWIGFCPLLVKASKISEILNVSEFSSAFEALDFAGIFCLLQ